MIRGALGNGYKGAVSLGGELGSVALVQGLRPGRQGSTLSQTGAQCPQQIFIKDGEKNLY